MDKFAGASFTWAVVLMVVLAVIFAVRALLAWHMIRSDAKADYSYKYDNRMVPDAIDRETYERIYRKVYGPRGPIHVAVGVIAILLATPPAMWACEKGFNLMYNLSGQSRVIEPGFLVWHFFLFFSMIAVWVSVAYLVARHYHKTEPGSLQFELDRYLYGSSEDLDQTPDDEEDRRFKTQLVLTLISAIAASVFYLMRRL